MEKLSFNTSPLAATLLAAVLPFFMLCTSGCDRRLDTPSEPESIQDSDLLSEDDPQIKAVMAVQDRHTAELLANPQVVGTATGLTEDGRPGILVFTKTDIMSEALAKGRPAPIAESLEGIPVIVKVTGEIAPADGPPANNHRDFQEAPIILGVSGSWRWDCCVGTLGSLVSSELAHKLYILSNWHVLYTDIVPGTNGRVALPGDNVVSPGILDSRNNCEIHDNTVYVANLVTGGGSLPAANVDAGIAEVVIFDPGYLVKPSGEILDIGTISGNTLRPRLFSSIFPPRPQRVKKSGRTTGLTRSIIIGINGTVTIAYANECGAAPGSAFTQTFTGQIVIANPNCAFLQRGDSGSLLVEDVSNNPRAMGLCFAASINCVPQAVAWANPIDDVLSYYSNTLGGTWRMVGR